MDFKEFTGKVQDELELATQAEAVRASRAFLTTLSERLYPGEADDLAGSLPMEIDHYVISASSGQRFSRDEFIQRVADIEHVDEPDAFRHIQLMMKILGETVPPGELADIRDGLPDEFEDFFEVVQIEAQ